MNGYNQICHRNNSLRQLQMPSVTVKLITEWTLFSLWVNLWMKRDSDS